MKKSAVRLPALDALRFVAATGVVAYHYISSYLPHDASTPWVEATSRFTRYGYLGVELFFMISGFVILWSAQGRTAATFVISRISRLYPSFWAAVALSTAVLLVMPAFFAEIPASDIGLKQFVGNLTMIPGLLDIERIDGVYWTLEFEIRFYLLIYVLLLVGQIKNIEGWLYAWLLVCCVETFYAVPWPMGFFALMPYGPFFLGGCLLYVVYASGWTMVRALAMAITVWAAAVNSLDVRSGFIEPDPISGAVVPLTVLVFFGIFLIVFRWNDLFASNKLAYRLGALTYPLYLTHAAIGHLIIDVLVPRVGGALALTIATMSALLIAQLLVMLVDEPARKPMANLCQRVLAHVSFATATIRRGFRKPGRG